VEGLNVQLNGHLQLHILVKLVGKGQHGLRARDLDSNDKQNFAAVEHLIKASPLLSNIPDALATQYFLDAEQRLEEIWYSTFFLRYWRQWILLQKAFTLKNNFITSNCYNCIEINAHSLLAYTIIMRDTYSQTPEVFVPWLMGSQSCEQTFRSLRSMTGNFSTIINFSMLGMLQRLHKLSIKEELQSQSEIEQHQIRLPRVEVHHKKVGHGLYQQQPFQHLTNDVICNIMHKAEARAKAAISILGMADDLKNAHMWEIPPLTGYLLEFEKNEVEDNEEEKMEDEVIKGEKEDESIKESTDDDTLGELLNDLDQLNRLQIMDNSIIQKVKDKHIEKAFRRSKYQGEFISVY
jgi:hypothetical protein